MKGVENEWIRSLSGWLDGSWISRAEFEKSKTHFSENKETVNVITVNGNETVTVSQKWVRR
jgi:hypothetical protein